MSNSSSVRFQANDRWAAVGDSITHTGFYHHFVYLYYLTRFPRQKMLLFNCGISGDTAAKVLKRLDGDVLSHQPTVATILMGMNDVQGDLYDPEKSGPAVEAERAETLQTYRTDMRRLLTRIQKTGARMIVVTPTIYDETLISQNAATCRMGYNRALDCCAEIATLLAPEFGAGVIDLHNPLARWNTELQQADPSFTLVGMDRVHPAETGHFVMAYEFLKAQGAPRLVSRITLDARSGEPRDMVNAHVDNVKRDENFLEFDNLESALPYPVPAACKSALEFLPFVEELNQEILQIDDLAHGDYELRIDGEAIATYSGEQLREGVNLAMEPATPQFRHSQTILELATRRMEIYRNPLRCFTEMESGFLADYAGDLNDKESIKAHLYAKVEKDCGQPWYDYCKSQAAAYLENKPREKEFWTEFDAVTEAIFKKNIPESHHFAITAVT